MPQFAVILPAAGQSSLNGKTLVGHCVNFLPIRMKLTGDPAFGDLLAESRGKLLKAFEHQSYTYGTLVRKLAIPRKPSRLPLIEAQFNLERIGDKLNLHGLDAQVAQSPKRFVNFDLFLNMVESSEGLVKIGLGRLVGKDRPVPTVRPDRMNGRAVTAASPRSRAGPRR